METGPEAAEPSSPWWIPFWITFAISWLIGLPLFSLVTWCTLLVALRRHDNDVSRQAWIAFWLSARNIWATLFVGTSQEFYGLAVVILGLVRLLAIGPDADGRFYELPPAVFWPLVVCLLPTLAVLFSNGSLELFALGLYNTHFAKDGLHLPGVLISGWLLMFLAAAYLVGVNYVTFKQYVPAVFVYFGVVAIMHAQMWPYNEDFGFWWIVAWYLLYHAILYAYAPFMHPLWYAMWTCIIALLGLLFRPDHSLGQFMAWAVTIWVLRLVLYGVYMFYFKGGEDIRAGLFPFNLFSHKWRASRDPWLPLRARPLDDLNAAMLCAKCSAFTSESKLVMGSTAYLTRLEEWHDGFWTREQFAAMFAEPDNPAAVACPVCSLLWYSMSPERQRSITARLDTADDAGNHVQLARPRDPGAALRIKIWEERPLSFYTYMQLFWGDIPAGARLLVHRDLTPATPSPAAGCRRTDSPAHFEQARKWLQTCCDSHALCHGAGNSEPVRPARMLFVSGGTAWQPGDAPETVRLVPSDEVDFGGKGYLALSHCWGPPSEMRFKLLASNIDACYQGIAFHGLSKNMQDAITTTLALGFSYIWIDSLCIMQKDDTGQDHEAVAHLWQQDWDTEAPKMGSVYSAAACTIASTGSSTSSGGCFHDRNPSALAVCKIGVSSADQLSPSGWIYARRDDVFAFERGIALAPLNTRGWVMQERLLSRRILHFGADMLFWECGGRSASELNPHGYVYKRYPEDFSNNYLPNIGKNITTRGDAEQADREGRGFLWANQEAVRRRPPPVMIDPDSPGDGQQAWQLKRGFWKNVLKSTAEPWSDDEKEEANDENDKNQDDSSNAKRKKARAGFRAAFEQLRRGAAADHPPIGDHVVLSQPVQVGQTSFSQAWYDIVETYSRGHLTAARDKLMAMKGIQDEVARVTRFTYLYGLWRERLVTDLLWFAIDGPGKRLLLVDGHGQDRPVAPTWSWASIEGAVALDLLPENSLTEIALKQTLVTIYAVHDDAGDPAQTRIDLTGPLLPVATPYFAGGVWNINVGQTDRPSARFFPDTADAVDGLGTAGALCCLTFLVLDRDKTHSLIRASSEDVQGLVLRRIRGPASSDLAFYERVGYFTTSYVTKSRQASQGRKTLKAATVERVCLVGWSETQPLPAATGPHSPAV